MPANEDELYQERILDHYESPYHRGHCPARDARRTKTIIRSAATWCGWNLKSTLDERIEQAYFEGDGCCISQAAASMLVQHIEGNRVEESQTLTADDMLRLFGGSADAEPAKMLLAAVAGAASGVALASGIRRLAARAETATVIQYPHGDWADLPVLMSVAIRFATGILRFWFRLRSWSSHEKSSRCRRIALLHPNRGDTGTRIGETVAIRATR